MQFAAEERKSLTKARDQALLDAKRALSSINSSGKNARESIRAKEMAEEDRNAAYREMQAAQEAQAGAEAAAAEAIRDRDRVLALKASIDAQSSDNDRLRSDLHAAHEAQTRAEAERHAAQQTAARAQEEAAEAIRGREEAEEARRAAEEAKRGLEQALAAMKDTVVGYQKQVEIWKRDCEKAVEAKIKEEDKLLAATEAMSRMKQTLERSIEESESKEEQRELLEREVELCNAHISTLEEELDRAKMGVEDAERLTSTVRAELRALEEEMVAVQEGAEEEVAAVRRELEARVAESDAELKRLQSALEAAEAAAADGSRQVQGGDGEESGSSSDSDTSAAAAATAAALEAVEEEKAKLEEEVKRLQSAVKQLEKENEQKNAMVKDGLKKIGDVNWYKTENEALEQELAVLKKQKNDAIAKDERVAQLVKEVENLRELNRKLMTAIRETRAAAAATSS